MTNLEQLRSLPVEEVAEERVRLKWHSFNKYGQEDAYAEALRLEIAWLNSEVEVDK